MAIPRNIVHQSIDTALSERITEIVESLGGGSAENYPEYSRAVGEVKGLEAAKELVSQSFKQYLDEAFGD